MTGSSAFTVEVQFSGTPAGLNAKRDAASVLEVTGGSVTKARQTTGGANPVWEVTIAPDGAGDVTVTVPARACNEAHAVCIGGQPLAEAAEATVAGLPTVSIAAAETPVTEGAAAAFTLSRTGATDDALTVQVSVSETGAVASGTLPTSATFAAGSASAALSVATEDDATVESASTVTAAVSAGTGYAVSESAGSAAVVVNDNDAALTASFTQAPSTHDGSSAFELRFAFSHEPRGYSWRTVKDRLFTVTGGTIEKASRTTRGSSLGWKIRVAPAGNADVTLTATATTDCAAQHAACDASGRKFDGNLTTTVTGPQTLTRSLPAVSIAAPATTPVTEGTALAFTLTRTGATDAALTVNVSVTESGATLGASPPTTVTFAASSATAVLSVATEDDETVEEASTVTAAVTAGTGYTVAGDASSASGVVESEDLEPITATWSEVPTEHDGASAFRAKITFSHALSGYSFRSMQAHLFEVTGGRIVKAGRDGQPRNTKWAIRIVPAGNGDVTLAARATADCSAAHAVCDADGRKFDGNLAATVQGPPTLSAADAEVEEAEGATLDFAVTLSRAVNETVTVAYATSDGTAAAGPDYSATSGTLTFAANETSKTVSVPVLNDSHDEGSETLTFTLSNPNPSRVKLADAEAVGTIANDDPLQKQWLARFGRTVASQMIEALEIRSAAGPDTLSHMVVAGQRLDFSGAPAPGPGLEWAEHDHRRGGEARGMDMRDLLLGSSFHFTTGDAFGAGAVTAWGKALSGGSSSGSTAGGLSFSSETATGVLGMDWERDNLLFGLAMSQSVETGRAVSVSSEYDIEGSLLMAAPYARLRAGERLSVWALAGSGEGRMSLAYGGVRQSTDIAMRLVAAGGRADLLRPEGGGGFALALKTDAFFVTTASEGVSAPGVGNLAAARGDASRVRAVLEGSRSFALPGGGSVEPSLSLGLRHDDGDAETGTGMELGAGLTWSDPSRGLASGVRFHGLAAHEAGGYGEWGVSGSLRLAPDPSGRGASLSMTPSWGAQGRDGRLWVAEPGTLAPAHEADASGRLQAELGYGLAAFGGGFTGTPNLGLGLSESGRDWRLGWRLTPALRGVPGFEVNLDATRREPANDNGPVEHGIALSAAIRW